MVSQIIEVEKDTILCTPCLKSSNCFFRNNVTIHSCFNVQEYKAVYQEIKSSFYLNSDWRHVGLQASLELDTNIDSLLDQIFKIKERLLFIRIYEMYAIDGITSCLLFEILANLFGGKCFIRNLDVILKDPHSLISHAKTIYEESRGTV